MTDHTSVKHEITETAVFGGGCFWCTEAVFKRVNGVLTVTPGYSGGELPYPTSEQVSGGTTGHAEVILITFNPSVITYEVLLNIFFATHDPTTLNRQGADTGTQYRSVIFYHNDSQKEKAERAIRKLADTSTMTGSIVTEIVPFSVFYRAEEYHHNYYDTNRSQPYCRLVIDPKIRKLLEKYRNRLKPEFNIDRAGKM
jgi:peptide-methionine (S)-S-oxide reductase